METSCRIISLLLVAAPLEPGSNSVVSECGTWQSTGPLFNQMFVKLYVVQVGFGVGARDTQGCQIPRTPRHRANAATINIGQALKCVT